MTISSLMGSSSWDLVWGLMLFLGAVLSNCFSLPERHSLRVLELQVPPYNCQMGISSGTLGQHEPGAAQDPLAYPTTGI